MGNPGPAIGFESGVLLYASSLLAGVAPAVLAPLWAPGNERLRNEVAVRALSAAETSGDPLMQFSVNLAARQVAIESGDLVMAAHNLARLRATAQNVGEPTCGGSSWWPRRSRR